MIHDLEEKYKGEIAQKNEKNYFLEDEVKQLKIQISTLTLSLEQEKESNLNLKNKLSETEVMRDTIKKELAVSQESLTILMN